MTDMTTDDNKAMDAAERKLFERALHEPDANGWTDWECATEEQREWMFKGWNRRRALTASEAKTVVPRFIVRKAEQAIHTATHPTGMRTNGPAYAQIEVSHLMALLRYATASSPAKAGSAQQVAEAKTAVPEGAAFAESRLMAVTEEWIRGFNACRALAFSPVSGWLDRSALTASEAPVVPEGLRKITELIVQHYIDQPDDYVISIGGWKDDQVLGPPMKDFWAYLAVPMADWRKYAAAPSSPVLDEAKPGMAADALNTMLWLYRRLPRTYGRPPAVERSINALASKTGTAVAEFLAERDDATPSQQAQQDGWVSVEEKIPESCVEVMVWPHPTEGCLTAERRKDGRWVYGEYERGLGWVAEEMRTPTHWRQMPAPPGAGKEQA